MRCPHTGETLDCAFLRRFIDELGTLDVTSKRDRYQLEKIARYSRVAYNQLTDKHLRACAVREGDVTPEKSERKASDWEMERMGLMRQILKNVNLYAQSKMHTSFLPIDPEITLVGYEP